MSDNLNARARKLGELIQQARTHAGRSVEACAEVLGISVEEFNQAEQGEYLVSLPDLESLAIYLRVPMAYFWGTHSLEKRFTLSEYHNLISLRHRVIGILLRQLRLEEKKTQKELAEAIDIDRTLMREYETGTVPIPYLHLEGLCGQLGVSITHFVEDHHGPLGRHESETKVRKLFHEMSPQLQEFLLNPVNVSYLETAWRLSEMDVEKLRLIAESLLDITY